MEASRDFGDWRRSRKALSSGSGKRHLEATHDRLAWRISVFLGDNYGSPGFCPSGSVRRSADIAVGDDGHPLRPCRPAIWRQRSAARPDRHLRVRLRSDVIGNLRRGGGHHRGKMAGADTPTPTTQFSSTSYCYDIDAYWWRSGWRGDAWNQSTAPGDAAGAVAEIRRYVSRAMQSRFSEDLTIRCSGGSGYQPGARRSISWSTRPRRSTRHSPNILFRRRRVKPDV